MKNLVSVDEVTVDEVSPPVVPNVIVPQEVMSDGVMDTENVIGAPQQVLMEGEHAV